MRKTPKIVKAHNVIGMGVRENYRVNVSNVFAQRLRPEIGSRVDNPRTLWGLDID